MQNTGAMTYLLSHLPGAKLWATVKTSCMLLRKIWHKLAFGECLLLKWPLGWNIASEGLWFCWWGWRGLQGMGSHFPAHFFAALWMIGVWYSQKQVILTTHPKNSEVSWSDSSLPFCLEMVLRFLQWCVTISDLAYFSVIFLHGWQPMRKNVCVECLWWLNLSQPHPVGWGRELGEEECSDKAAQ